ncbi:MAG: zinc metallopeptidase [Eubacteriales bacterium]|nr:zinc metallopeptidase [Eubacteriales bacterium]MDD3883063.1 zinc metallopeptidase [Eubacteriales bacterium]MDD4513614.1 zinc metallopeptidase [Eubacteriales bacterium]
MYWDWTYLLMLPGLILGLWSQARVKSAYAKYGKVLSRSGMSAAEVARDLLEKGAPGVTVKRVAGELTDHFDPRDDTLALSDGVFASSSVAAIGIAAHEAGHAMQKNDDYAPMKLRTAIAPVVSIGSNLSWPIFIIGIIFSFQPLVFAGILVFSLAVLFSLITLPVEFDASRRALRALESGGYLDAGELKGAKSVLTAAALTYLASFVSMVLQLLRLLLIANSSRRRD